MQASPSTLCRRGPLGRAPRAVLLAVAAALAACSEPDRSARIVRDPELRNAAVSLYPAADSTRPPRALIVFFGNDIGFWRPHRQLASSLADAQYAVAGLDIRVLSATAPSPRTSSAWSNGLGTSFEAIQSRSSSPATHSAPSSRSGSRLIRVFLESPACSRLPRVLAVICAYR
jgi:hypothetical protein